MRNTNIIGNRIRMYRQARGMSLADLSKALGSVVTRQMLCKYEQGKTVPRVTLQIEIARVFGIKTAHLWQPPKIRTVFIEHRRP